MGLITTGIVYLGKKAVKAAAAAAVEKGVTTAVGAAVDSVVSKFSSKPKVQIDMLNEPCPKCKGKHSILNKEEDCIVQCDSCGSVIGRYKVVDDGRAKDEV